MTSVVVVWGEDANRKGRTTRPLVGKEFISQKLNGIKRWFAPPWPNPEVDGSAPVIVILIVPGRFVSFVCLLLGNTIHSSWDAIRYDMGQTATGQASNLCLLLSAEIKARIPPFRKPISRALPTYATLGRKVVLLVAMGYLVLVLHIVPCTEELTIFWYSHTRHSLRGIH